MDFHLVEANPATPWVVPALHDLDVEISIQSFGEDDTTSASGKARKLSDQSSAIRGALLALPGSAPIAAPVGRFGLPVSPEEPTEVLGAATFALPKQENLHLLDDGYIRVRPAAQRQGIATALFGQLREICVQSRRDTLLLWSEHLAATADSFSQVVPVTGSGSVPRDPATDFALARGFTLAQVERRSRLELPIDQETLTGLCAHAESVANAGYHLVSWAGPMPTIHLSRVSEMNHVLSAEAPLGGIDYAPEEWDADRVCHSDVQLHRTGRSIYTLALTNDTEAVAGLTTIYVEAERPDRANQFNTVVLAEHRGHRLGLWMKATNLALLATEYPQARYLDTWNANENRPMLAINTALGYRLHAVNGAWQLKTG